MKKGVVYTCITGEYDELRDHTFRHPDWDYICFSDVPEKMRTKNNTSWEIRELKFSKLDNTRNQRWHKLHPHKLFPEYEWSLWVDGNIDILKKEVFEDIEKIKGEKKTIALSKHPFRNCIYEEFEACISREKDAINVMEQQIIFMKERGYPLGNGLFETGVIFRVHHNASIISLMEAWWDWIEKYSLRDQLSLTYVAWKNQIELVPLSEVPYNTIQDERIYIHQHGKRIINMKFFKKKVVWVKKFDNLRDKVVFIFFEPRKFFRKYCKKITK